MFPGYEYDSKDEYKNDDNMSEYSTDLIQSFGPGGAWPRLDMFLVLMAVMLVIAIMILVYYIRICNKSNKKYESIKH